ncbi:FtsK/SpoIIIE domain-containing protein [Nocardia aurea]|uniref:FtsK/SpoIIIE domain-containing protein n=1 Tax=Nocardia aurea TaxID=2144174 RepID=UPI0033AD0C68
MTDSDAALVRAAALMSTLRPSWQQVCDTVESTSRQMLTDVIGAHRDVRAETQRLESSRLRLSEAFERRFGTTAGRYGSTSPMDIDTWCDTADHLTSELNSGWVPLTRNGREASRKKFESRVAPHLGAYEALRRDFLAREWSAMITSGSADAARRSAHGAATLSPIPLPPAPIGPLTDPSAADHLEPGPGPLNVFLGSAHAREIVFESHGSEKCGGGTHALALPGVRIPLVIDLDLVGGFAVADRSCLETPLLNLVAVLPAHRLLIKIFDPERGGDSAKFLYNLGDAAERVIGDRVKTTDRDLSELLQETAEHITFVTQRYLQGEHKTLTAYNQAAGEVAEPYRIVTLYDFPSGFTRGGHPDTDALDLVGKIVRNGPRAGVFTVFTCAEEFLSDGEKTDVFIGTPEQRASRKQLRAPLDALPYFATKLTGPTLDVMNSSGAAARITHHYRAFAKNPSGASVGGDIELRWDFVPGARPTQPIAAKLIEKIRRNQHSADDVRVTPQRVAQLASAEEAANAQVFGTTTRSTVADPTDESTWWRATSVDAVVGGFGRIGARGVANLTLDSQVDSFAALIGGRPGSGKSVLLHAAIMSIAINYSPEEVDLFLVDFKEGVEFKRYADDGLPHARVIATEAERDFGLSVLRLARAEISARGTAFKVSDGGSVSSAEYRARSGERCTRWVLIIDEFQQLFYRDDAIAHEAAEIVEQIVRLGRSFGIHLVLASQTLAGMDSLGKHVLGMIPQRIALQSSEADSRLLLGDDNPDAQTLTRAGEGIFNNRGGFKDANKRFQAAYWDPDDRSRALQLMTRRARHNGLSNKTRVFNGYSAAELGELAMPDLIARSGKGTPIMLPAGMSCALDAEPIGIALRRESGANVLVVDESGPGPLVAMLSALSAQSVTVELLDFTSEEDDEHKTIVALGNARVCTVHRRRALQSVSARILEEIERRHSLSEYRAAPIVLAFAGMGRARDIDPDDYGDDTLSARLSRILRDGPEVGVHVLAWFERGVGVDRRLKSQARNEFAHRLAGRLSRDDSMTIVSSETAADLKAGQAVLADLDRATEVRVRKFAVPEPEKLVEFVGGIR